MAYKWCVVPQCLNSSIKTPDKIFVSIPKNTMIRQKWLMLARRNPNEISASTNAFMCEDHFNLPNDMDNYMKYRIMGSVKKVRLKPNCMPSKFSWQSARIAENITTPIAAETKRIDLGYETENMLLDNIVTDSTTSTSMITTCTCSKQTVGTDTTFCNRSTQANPNTENKYVQASLRPKYRSKATQKTVNTRNSSNSPILTHSISFAMSPLKEINSNVSSEDPISDPIWEVNVKNELEQPESAHNLCEICLQNCVDVNYCISKTIAKDVIEKICTCFNIVITRSECVPFGICSNCAYALNVAYDFRLKCLSFEKRLSSLCEVYVEKPPVNVKVEVDSVHSNEDEQEVSIDNSAGDTDEIDVTLEECKCSVCNKILKSKESLSRHNVVMHQNRKHLGKVTGCGENRRYHCTKCPYKTPHSQTLVNHMRRHNGERPYRCECGKSFTQSSSLAAHRKTHSTTTYFTCATCGKQFKHAFTLKKHLQVHETGKFYCDICHKTLKSAKSLQDHKHRHYNIKNYNCEDCGDTFVTCSELLNHKKKHSSVKKIGCQMCSYKTHTKKNLIIHMKRHMGDKSVRCGVCEQSFYTSGDLRRHERVHSREKPFACPTCAQRFTHSTSLNKHIRNIHGLDYKWGDFKFRESRSFQEHKSVQIKIEKDNEK